VQRRAGKEAPARMPRAGELELRTGALLRRLVDLASHRSGTALALMGQSGITFPQLILLARVKRLGTASLSALAAVSGASLPATSQMIERLANLGMLARTDDPADRRRRALAVTARGSEVLARIGAARAADYAESLDGVPPSLLRSLAAALRPVVERLE
jgi:DNA-binding MarR family transcriptional regulator